MTTTISFALRASKPRTRAAREAMEYQRLLGASLPHVIQTEEENDHYLKMLEALDQRAIELHERVTASQQPDEPDARTAARRQQSPDNTTARLQTDRRWHSADRRVPGTATQPH